MSRVSMKGINVKQTKDGEEFHIGFVIVEDNWDDAKKIADEVKHKLQNILDNQTTLN